MPYLQGQGKGKFVESVQRQIGKELNIPIHDFTVQQKKQLMQQHKQTRRAE